MSPQYVHVILLSGFPFLTAVQYQVTGSHITLKVRDFTLVSLWCGRSDGRTVTDLPKFPGWIDNQIFLAIGLRLRAPVRGAPL